MWNGLYEKVGMVFVDANFEEIDIVCGSEFHTHGFQGVCHFFAKHIPAIFHGADQVVYEKRLVVRFL